MSKHPDHTAMHFKDGPRVDFIWEGDLLKMFIDDVRWFPKHGAVNEIERLTLVTEGQLSEIERLKEHNAKIWDEVLRLRAREDEVRHD